MAMPGAASEDGPCRIDLVRPTAADRPGPKGRKISEATWQRREYGRSMKQDFYQKATGLSGLPEFANDFEEIATPAGFGGLDRKLALFYADGNGFGALQARTCVTRKKQRQFDTELREKRKELLAVLLRDMPPDPDWMNHDKLRFETLLWGGDEIIWVMPAWKGWEVARRFFELTRDWSFAGQKLTHGAGLVFCHQKAPIHRLTALAHSLAEECKGCDRKRNLLAVQILESFDHLGMDPAGYRREQCPPKVQPDELLLAGDTLPHADENMAAVRQALPRRRLYAIVRELRAGNETDAEKKVNAALFEMGDSGRQSMVGLERCFKTGTAFWHHLVELWDYITPEKNKGGRL